MFMWSVVMTYLSVIDPPGVLVRLDTGVAASASLISSGVMGWVLCLPSYLYFLLGVSVELGPSAGSSVGWVLYLQHGSGVCDYQGSLLVLGQIEVGQGYLDIVCDWA